MEPTHASFFSGAGGLDLGLERAGWRTVSLSEIDPYASAVLARHWPGVPNLGDIVAVGHERGGDDRRIGTLDPDAWQRATLWSGGFPCQDLSVAGKRAGLAGSRSGLAFTFVALVERWRPPALLLENVPGLLSSHHGRDFYALQRAMAQLGYVGAWRILDARHFGVPQRRRRVFIVAIRADLDPSGERAAEVLSVGSRCGRHPPSGTEAWEGVADGAVPGVDIARAVTGTSGKRHDDDTDTLVASETGKGWWTEGGEASAFRAQGGGTPHHAVIQRPSPDPGGDRTPDGLAGRAYDRGGVAPTLVAPDARHRVAGDDMSAADLLPLGLDSHRYRCCGNGVVASVSEWVGARLLRALDVKP